MISIWKPLSILFILTGAFNVFADAGFDAIAADIDKIRIVWRLDKYSKDKPVAYGVRYESVGEPAVYRLIYNRNSLNYTISNLKENKEYLIAVTVFMHLGVFKVAKKKVKTKRLILLPTNPIRNLSIASISWNAVSLFWMAPENYSDPAIMYEVKCKGGEHEIIKQVKQGNIRFEDLREDTNYQIEAKAGAEGVGLFHERATLKFRTQTRFPVPIGLNVTLLNWNAAKVEWFAVRRREDLVYKIILYDESNPMQKKFVETNNTKVELINLQQESGYFVAVQVGNGTIFGRISPRIFIITADRDECIDGSHSCKMFENCLNTKGSYECHCQQGYLRAGSNCKPMKRSEPKCSNDYARKLTWRLTQNGQTTYIKCPNGTTGIAHRYCERLNSTHARWLSPDLSSCVSTWLHQFSHKLRDATQNSSFLMKTLNSEYHKQNEVVGGDIRNVVSMMGNIVEKSDASSTTDLNDMAQNLVFLTDDLLSPKTAETWNDLPRGRRAKSAGGLLTNVEKMARVYSSALKNTSLVISTQNAVMEIKNILDASSLKFSEDKNTSQSSISIPLAALELNQEDSNAVYFGSFKRIEKLLGGALVKHSSTEIEFNRKRISNVIAATILANKKNHFEQPVVITQRLPEENRSRSLNCVFWDFSKRENLGAWSTKGCQLHESNKTHATCHCYHLTNFAVLMSVTKAPLRMKKVHKEVMYLITTICICISLLALLVSFVTFCSVRALQSDRNTTHKNLVVALFLAQIIFVCGIDKTVNIIACRIIGLTLHYFFLVVFSLMGMEGFVLYMMLIRVYKRNGGYGNRKLLFACWVLPVLIVSLTAGLDFTAYGNENYCWINVKDGFIWSFVGPVILVIFFNSVIMALAIKIMRKKSKKRDAFSQEIWYWIKCCSMLVSILGLSWIIGIFYVNQNSIVMAYVFSILNSLQGLSMFVFLCLLDQRVKDTYCKVLCCIERGHFNISAARSLTGTKSTLPSRQSKEVSENSLKRSLEERKSLRLSKISMEDQEIAVDFSEEENQMVDL